MTPEIVEGNKLIAEFLGWLYHTKEYNWKRSRIDYPTWSDGTMGWKELHFHTSWDWLMPVVEKIEKGLFATRCEYYGGEDRVYFTISKDYGGETIYNHTESGTISDKIIVYWESVVQFIKWYNQNK